jgi:hypothetical protein
VHTCFAFLHCDKIPEKTTEKKKDLFWLMVLVHGWLALLLLDLWEDRNMAEGMMEESCSPHGCQEAERHQEEKGMRCFLPRHPLAVFF